MEKKKKTTHTERKLPRSQPISWPRTGPSPVLSKLQPHDTNRVRVAQSGPRSSLIGQYWNIFVAPVLPNSDIFIRSRDMAVLTNS